MKLTNKHPYAPQLDGLVACKIVAKENIADLNTNPIGTGPFQFVENVQDDHLTLKRFPGYYNADQTYLDQFTIKIVKDPTALQQALLAGQVDMIWPVPDIIAAISRSMRLEAGDLVYTGTPAGVGPLVPGDRCTVSIEGLGTIESTITPA